MWPEDLFNFVLEDLADEIAMETIPLAQPMPCDRWLARSAIQKAVRRGEVGIALQALTTLLIRHPAGVWRDLTIIALEDVGVAGIDTVSRVVAAARDRNWRRDHGGDWKVASVLVKRMAEDVHCQAACDLSLKLANDPAMQSLRVEALEFDACDLATIVADRTADLYYRAVAVLALAGGLAEEQRFLQPTAVFEAIGSMGRSTHVVATAQAAWKITRDDMALFLPLVWDEWMNEKRPLVQDDDLGSTELISEVPSYAIDQHTRLGQSVIRAYLKGDHDMLALLNSAGVQPARRHKVVGDLLFLTEGGLVKRHSIWHQGERLRLPARPVSGIFKLETAMSAALAKITSKARQINALRRLQLHPASR